MSLASENRRLTDNSKRSSRRRGMDEELHEHVDQVSGSKEVPSNSYETAPLTDYEVDESSTSIPADDDSFGEATADCIPDKKFLEAILEDYHPNRVDTAFDHCNRHPQLYFLDQ